MLYTIKVVTFSDVKNLYSDNWENSMKKAGYDYKILTGKWEGFMSKVKATLDYIKTITSDLIVFLDCHDAFAYKSSKGLDYEFLALDCDIVASAEKMCFGNCLPLEQFKDRGASKYLNSGFYMGYREKVINMLEWIFQSGQKDDQLAVCSYFKANPQNYKLDIDSSSRLCQTIHAIEIDFNPYFVHMPGSLVDGFSRYNEYGKYILSSSFKPSMMMTEKNSKIYAIIILFLSILILFFPKLSFIILPLLTLFIFLIYVYTH